MSRIKLTLYVEGGGSPDDRSKGGEPPARTGRNMRDVTGGSERPSNFYPALRSALSKLFQLTAQSDAIRIKPHGGDKQTARLFLDDSREWDRLLLVDLEKKDDQEGKNRSERLSELRIERDENRKRVFFMVQEMEAWFFSQPEAIVDYYGHEKGCPLTVDAVKKNDYFLKKPHEIKKPSRGLKDALRQVLPNDKTWRQLCLYRKRDAPELLTRLEIDSLTENFPDVKRLRERIRKVLGDHA